MCIWPVKTSIAEPCVSICQFCPFHFMPSKKPNLILSDFALYHNPLASIPEVNWGVWELTKQLTKIKFFDVNVSSCKLAFYNPICLSKYNNTKSLAVHLAEIPIPIPVPY